MDNETITADTTLRITKIAAGRYKVIAVRADGTCAWFVPFRTMRAAVKYMAAHARLNAGDV